MSAVQELSGTVLEGRRLADRLGWTSHTAVYLAPGDGRQLVVKVFDSVLEPGDGLARRLSYECAVLAELGHPAIVPIEAVGRAEGLTFTVSPFVAAQPLQQLLDAGRLDNEQAWRVVSRVAEVLDAIHDRGLVYRTLKPINILVDERNNAYLAEFGMLGSRAGPLALADPSAVLTTPQYLAPEQVEGQEPGARADVYALAVLAFEILTASRLHASQSVAETLQATLAGRPPSAHARVPALPRGVDAILAGAMARDPQARPRRASELLDELVTVPDDRPVVVRRPAPAAAPAPAAGPAPLAANGPAGGPFTGKAPIAADSMVTVLSRAGVPVYHGTQRRLLTSYFAVLMRCARETAGPRWPEVRAASGLVDGGDGEPPEDGALGVPLEDASRLAAAFDDVYGLEAPGAQRMWGRQTMEHWIRTRGPLRDDSQPRPRRLWPRQSPEQKVEEVLSGLARSLERVRGESLTTWKQVEHRQYWLVQYDNLMAVGRRRPARSCYFWTAAVEAALRSRGLANDWVVEEAECGCVTGSYNCVFTIQHAPF
jgi:hypothetical protein